MSRFTARNCNCEDYPCCGCPGIEVATGGDAVAYYEHMEAQAADDEDYEPDDSMDGDHESGLASAGMGEDCREDYGYVDDTPMGDEFGG